MSNENEVTNEPMPHESNEELVTEASIVDEISEVTPEQWKYLEERATGPEILIPKKNVVLDSQILSTLMRCARLTDLRYNHHLVSLSGKSVSIEMGSIVHTFLEVYYKTIINGQFRSKAEELADEHARAYAKSDKVKNTTLEEREWAVDSCHQYLERWKRDTWMPLEVEKVKGKILYEDDEVRILYKVKYDLIVDTPQGIYPVDHKSMKQRRDTLSLNNQFIGQCIVQGTSRMFVDKVGFQKSLKPEEKFTRDPIPYSADRLKEWQYEILPYYVKLMIEYSESGYFPPNFSGCETKFGFCDFRKVCEAERNLREDVLKELFVVGEPWDVTSED